MTTRLCLGCGRFCLTLHRTVDGAMRCEDCSLEVAVLLTLVRIGDAA